MAFERVIERALGKLEPRFELWVPQFIVRYYRERYTRKRSRYSGLEKSLISARIPVSVPRYLAIAFFYSLILLPLYVLVSLFVSQIVGYYYMLYVSGELPPELYGLGSIPI
ncbi:hypothetical protein [Geoglobus sp.]